MNIMIIGKFYTEGFAQHIVETLESMGHHSIKFEPGRAYKSFNNSYLNILYKAFSVLMDIYYQTPAYELYLKNKLSSLINKSEIDLAIVSHDFLTPDQVDIFRQNGISVVMWYPDSISAFRKAYFNTAPYNCIFFKDPYIVNVLREEYGKTNVYYLPECANTKYLKAVEISNDEQIKYKCDISFAGNLHTFRVGLLNQLLGYDIKVWGNRAPLWMNTSKIDHMIMNEFVANEDKAKAFRSAKINLNSLQPGEIYGINVRTFEIAATGAFQLVNYRPGISQLYIEGEEIITFRNIRELKEKIEYYLPRKELRDQIGEKARLRTINEHTYQHRLALLIDTVFHGKEGFPLLSKYDQH